MRDEASGPSSVSFAPILEQEREFSFQHKFDSQKVDDDSQPLEITDEKREELKGFLPHDENSFSKSQAKYGGYYS